jgi:hypothetical protein
MLVFILTNSRIVEGAAICCSLSYSDLNLISVGYELPKALSLKH